MFKDVFSRSPLEGLEVWRCKAILCTVCSIVRRVMRLPTWDDRQKKSAESLRAPQKATTSSSEPLNSHHEPLVGKKASPLSAFRHWQVLDMSDGQAVVL